MADLMARYDAVVLAIGSEVPRDLPVPGRELKGIHYAMDFLTQQNRRVGGEKVNGADIMATGKHVLVIGGGDTGSDCIGTSNRHGAKSVTQIEILPMPPEHEDKLLTWPDWPMKLRTSSSHEEGIKRDWSVATKSFTGKDGHVTGLSSVRAEWRTSNDGRPLMEEVPDSDFEIKADLVLLAMGFVHPVKTGAVERARPRARSARQYQGRHERLSQLGRQGLRLRRRPPWAIAGRLGDPRRPAMRPRGRRVSDGKFRPPALSGRFAPATLRRFPSLVRRTITVFPASVATEL